MSTLLIGLLIVVSQSADQATESAASEEQARAERLADMQSRMSEYRIFSDAAADDQAELTLQRDPVYRWSRAISDIRDGTTFVWTRDGRPEVVTQIFFIAKPRPRWVHMFSSLSERTVHAEQEGQTVWKPTSPGVQFRPLPSASTPETTAALRGRQMRAILEDFDASMNWKDEVRYQLRAVPSPIYRYPRPAAAVRDGAIFAFSEGTNPKLLLCLEARHTDQSEQWVFAIVPLTVHAAAVTFKGEEVFTIPYRLETELAPEDPFFNRIIYVDEAGS